MIRRPTARTILLAALAFAGHCAAPILVEAADLDNEVRKEAGITPVEYASGWYLRGDIGTYHGAGTVDYSIGGAQSFNGTPLFSDVSVDVGVGYIFNDSLRADVTLSHVDNLQLRGLSSLGSCGAGYTGECMHLGNADVAFTDFSLNGYWTLGNWSGLRPYLGSGLGLALATWNNYNSQLVCVLDPGETCPSEPSASSHGRSTLGSFSLMVGTDYKFSDNWTLDLGYKFTHLIDFGLNDNTANLAEIGDVNIHQIRAGLRYEIW